MTIPERTQVSVRVYSGAVTVISDVNSSWTPGVFYTYFYNHARRRRIGKPLYIELSRNSNGYF
jgi:hypothetical protein